MDNKLSELSKPVGIHPEVREFIETGINDATTHDSVDQCDYLFAANLEKILQPLYSQDYVSALLAELEFEKQNNAGVAGMAEDYETKLEAKDKRIAELEEQSKQLKKELHNEGAANAYAYERIRKLEKRLATPVRLPKLSGDEDLAECVFKYVAAIRAAGFTAEGDEQ